MARKFDLCNAAGTGIRDKLIDIDPSPNKIIPIPGCACVEVAPPLPIARTCNREENAAHLNRVMPPSEEVPQHEQQGDQEEHDGDQQPERSFPARFADPDAASEGR